MRGVDEGGMPPSSSSMVRPHHGRHSRSGRVVAAGSAFVALLLAAVALQGKGSGARSELAAGKVGTVWANPWSLDAGSAASKSSAVAASAMAMASTMEKVTSWAPAPLSPQSNGEWTLWASSKESGGRDWSEQTGKVPSRRQRMREHGKCKSHSHSF